MLPYSPCPLFRPVQAMVHDLVGVQDNTVKLTSAKVLGPVTDLDGQCFPAYPEVPCWTVQRRSSRCFWARLVQGRVPSFPV